MLETLEKWSDSIKCSYCNAKFIITSEDIIYGDLRPAYLFVPDMQYYIDCKNCSNRLIINNIPSRIAVRIQERYV